MAFFIGRGFGEISGHGIMVADANVHHRKWLVRSNSNNAEGEHFYEFFLKSGMRQWVSHPTRGSYLLDLCLSNLTSLKVHVLPIIFDHREYWSKFRLSYLLRNL